MDGLFMGSGPTYIDNGEEQRCATWADWGPRPVPVIIAPMTLRARFAARWYAARVWLAEKVLRVPVGDDW